MQMQTVARSITELMSPRCDACPRSASRAADRSYPDSMSGPQCRSRGLGHARRSNSRALDDAESLVCCAPLLAPGNRRAGEPELHMTSTFGILALFPLLSSPSPAQSDVARA